MGPIDTWRSLLKWAFFVYGISALPWALYASWYIGNGYWEQKVESNHLWSWNHASGMAGTAPISAGFASTDSVDCLSRWAISKVFVPCMERCHFWATCSQTFPYLVWPLGLLVNVLDKHHAVLWPRLWHWSTDLTQDLGKVYVLAGDGCLFLPLFGLWGLN